MQRALSLFKCCKDDDIETFLFDKAQDFIDRGLCHAYLILNEEQFDNGKIEIEAYFTLSHKSIDLCELSKSKTKAIAGFKDRNSTAAVLIGHLGKHISSEYVSPISLEEILAFAFEVIRASSRLIPCRAVIVECSDAIRDKRIYETVDFKYLQKDNGLHQYYKIID